MKNIILISAILLIFCLSAYAQSPYERAMVKNLKQLSQSQSITDFQSVANTFERIGQKEKQEWLPLYYSALTYIIMGFDADLDRDQKDQYYKKAEELIAQAKAITNNSEITALQGYAVMGKLAVDPANRGQTLSPQAFKYFEKAIDQNPENPRAIFLMAQLQYGTAQFFGKSTEEPCKLARRSVNLYKSEAKMDTGIAPTWGHKRAVEMSEKCE
ncbi:hypothetical protein LVD15_02785 [Fulvivirga maritima]|uniref:hypothetical protein n=1 Tax=Fulvivirga maritima TaxID=2904247 RepID=UPI001F3BE22B|nr:hypothetical protein [Fulvivirga maritima]UII27373.1 hypothetical protein LVD15_02785 [Fulvivirga maritima]